MNNATLDFIRLHADADVRQLALRGAGAEVDLRYALEQIAGRQAARLKLPSWAAQEGMEYPPHISLEQCSGERAAEYKASVARRLVGAGTLVDLTGGFGVDFSFMARGRQRAVYVERQERLCAIASHNLPLLGLPDAEVVCDDGERFLMAMPDIGRTDAEHSPVSMADMGTSDAELSPPPSTIIYLDPARRDDAGGRTYAISDCTPDVIQLRDELLRRADYVLVKLSPMLDWRKAVGDLGKAVGEVHIVAVENECKDLLLVLSRRYNGVQKLFCINDDQTLTFDLKASHDTSLDVSDRSVSPQMYLFEPNAAVMKAGLFDAVERMFGARQVARNSHLFIASRDIADFPGRRFVIDRVVSMNKKELRRGLAGIDKANIAVRNFPLSVAALRQRLKIGDGGDVYIFATTIEKANHVLLVCRKI